VLIDNQAREDTGYVSAGAFCQKNNLPLEPYLAHGKGEASIKISQMVDYSEKFQVSGSWLILGIGSEKFPTKTEKSKTLKSNESALLLHSHGVSLMLHKAGIENIL
jgi:hypothetical protein